MKNLYEQFDRYKTNLGFEYSKRGDTCNIYSYNKLVAVVVLDQQIVIELDKSSITTNKHVNYVCSFFKFKKVELWSINWGKE